MFEVSKFPRFLFKHYVFNTLHQEWFEPSWIHEIGSDYVEILLGCLQQLKDKDDALKELKVAYKKFPQFVQFKVVKSFFGDDLGMIMLCQLVDFENIPGNFLVATVVKQELQTLFTILQEFDGISSITVQVV